MYVALILAGICILAFFVQFSVPGFTEALLVAKGQSFYEPWRLVTGIFLHGDIAHLFYNMFALALFGMILEKIVGKKRFLAVFFGAGVIASLGSALFYERALGASGAIFGVLGALAILRPKMQVWVSYMPMPMIAAAAFWALGDVVGLFVPSGVANLAHLLGLAVGVGTGLYLRNRFSERKSVSQNIDEKTLDEWEERYMR